jgi:hypothetical protein
MKKVIILLLVMLLGITSCTPTKPEYIEYNNFYPNLYYIPGFGYWYNRPYYRSYNIYYSYPRCIHYYRPNRSYYRGRR